jgi:hypothetical protein
LPSGEINDKYKKPAKNQNPILGQNLRTKKAALDEESIRLLFMLIVLQTYRFVQHAGNLILIAELSLTQLQDVLDAHREGQQEEDVGSRH